MAQKEYRAAQDTVIEGAPVRAGRGVSGLTEEKLKAYVSAGLLEEVKADKPAKEEAEAKNIDRTGDKRTGK